MTEHGHMNADRSEHEALVEILREVDWRLDPDGDLAADMATAVLRRFRAGDPAPTSTLQGDAPCAECGTEDNFVWFTDSTFWNNVIRRDGEDPYGYAEKRWGNCPILCLPCFVSVAEERGFRPTGWRVTPEWPWRRAVVGADPSEAGT